MLGKKSEGAAAIGSHGRGTEENSLAAVVYGMVQVRKKTTLASSLSVPSAAGIKNRTLTGSNRGLSVSFSFRKKSKKNGPKLQRMLSENPNLQSKRRKALDAGFEEEESSSGVGHGSTNVINSPIKLVDATGPTSHSSPDVRTVPIIEPFPGISLNPKGE